MVMVTIKQLTILIQLAQADKPFAIAALVMIFKIARDRKFPDEGVQSLIKNPEPIGTLGALLPDQKFDYLQACIELIFVDQKVFESELIFARSIAIKLGFKKNMVDFLVENFTKMSPTDLKTRAMADFS